MQIVKKKSKRVLDFLIYKNHCSLIKKLQTFIGNHNGIFVCRGRLSSFTNENVLDKHMQRCEQPEITSCKTLNESHSCWKKLFHKSPLHFMIVADF